MKRDRKHVEEDRAPILIHVSMGLILKATPDTKRGERKLVNTPQGQVEFSINGNPRRNKGKR